MKDSGVLFYDPGTGDRLTYEELRVTLADSVWPAGTVHSAIGAKAAILALLTAVVCGLDLTLRDESSLSEDITAAVAAEDSQNRRRRSFATVEDMIEAGRRQEGFRLTLYTSGSTGLPKQVRHTLPSLTRALKVGEHHAHDVWGLAYSPTHIAGVQVVLQAFFNCNPIIRIFGRGRLTVVSWLEAFGITHLSATPSFYRLLLPSDHVITTVRSVTLGGERCDADLVAKLKALFPSAKIRNLYASTEAGTLLVADGEVFAIPPELAGRVRVVEGQLELHPGLLGEFGGPATGSTSPLVEGAWYRTGDVVEVVSETPLRFRILSRDRDWVNVGGHKVNPGEVEAALLACAGVREARVYGRKNSVLGQVLCAEVVADDGFNEPSARAWLSTHLQPYKIPRMIKTVADIPKTRTGKVSRL